MGIVNVTPDSFSDGGLLESAERAIAHARSMAADGALIVDIGGESTRPGSDPVPFEVETARVLPVVRALAEDGNVVISIDTRHPDVAAAAIEAGAHLVNDITGLQDPELVEVCAATGTPVVIMHMQGDPKTMQLDPYYDDVVVEVTAFLRGQAAMALDAGVPSVMIDPGIGFGKTTAHNLSLLRAMPLVDDLPVLIGASRKRFIGELTGRPVARDRDAGSIGVHLDSARRGAAMVRVHDVSGHLAALAMQEVLTR